MKVQLINQFKTGGAAISFVQFPTKQEKKGNLAYEMVMENVASKAFGKASGIQNEKDQAVLAESKRVIEHYFFRCR